MNYKLYLWIWLAFINATSAILFAYDKFAAIREFRRIKETTLHALEVLGGVFSNLSLMYILRHKNKKANYYRWTWLALVLWMFVVLMLI